MIWLIFTVCLWHWNAESQSPFYVPGGISVTILLVIERGKIMPFSVSPFPPSYSFPAYLKKHNRNTFENYISVNIWLLNLFFYFHSLSSALFSLHLASFVSFLSSYSVLYISLYVSLSLSPSLFSFLFLHLAIFISLFSSVIICVLYSIFSLSLRSSIAFSLPSSLLLSFHSHLFSYFLYLRISHLLTLYFYL